MSFECHNAIDRCSLVFYVGFCTELIICGRILIVLSVTVDGVEEAVIW